MVNPSSNSIGVGIAALEKAMLERNNLREMMMLKVKERKLEQELLEAINNLVSTNGTRGTKTALAVS